MVKRLSCDMRDDYLLITIDPPIIGQKYGLGGKDISEVIVATRYKGDNLFPITNWPLDVHVARLLDNIPESAVKLSSSQFAEIAWAELYPTEESARLKKI